MFNYLSIFFVLLQIIFFVILLLITVAFFTLLERKVIAMVQRRRGPNVVGIFGMLQAIADGLKLFVKETIRPSSSDIVLFVLAPAISFVLALIGWVFIPLGSSPLMRIEGSNIAILYFLAISSLAVLAIILAGWSSNSKYAFLGALRSAAQMLCYEVAMGLSLFPVILGTGSLGVHSVISNQISGFWNIFSFFPAFCIFFICLVAETNRHPFDLPEAEAELVAGYNVEYSGIGFALFFLAEYANILLMCIILSLFFLGGTDAFFLLKLKYIANFAFLLEPFVLAFKVCFFAVIFILIRAYLPRFRPDQLMYLGWKVLLPIAFAYFLFNIFIYLIFPNISLIHFISFFETTLWSFFNKNLTEISQQIDFSSKNLKIEPVVDFTSPIDPSSDIFNQFYTFSLVLNEQLSSFFSLADLKENFSKFWIFSQLSVLYYTIIDSSIINFNFFSYLFFILNNFFKTVSFATMSPLPVSLHEDSFNLFFSLKNDFTICSEKNIKAKMLIDHFSDRLLLSDNTPVHHTTLTDCIANSSKSFKKNDHIISLNYTNAPQKLSQYHPAYTSSMQKDLLPKPKSDLFKAYEYHYSFLNTFVNLFPINNENNSVIFKLLKQDLNSLTSIFLQHQELYSIFKKNVKTSETLIYHIPLNNFINSENYPKENLGLAAKSLVHPTFFDLGSTIQRTQPGVPVLLSPFGYEHAYNAFSHLLVMRGKAKFAPMNRLPVLVENFFDQSVLASNFNFIQKFSQFIDADLTLNNKKDNNIIDAYNLDRMRFQRGLILNNISNVYGSLSDFLVMTLRDNFVNTYKSVSKDATEISGYIRHFESISSKIGTEKAFNFVEFAKSKQHETLSKLNYDFYPSQTLDIWSSHNRFYEGFLDFCEIKNKTLIKPIENLKGNISLMGGSWFEKLFFSPVSGRTLSPFKDPNALSVFISDGVTLVKNPKYEAFLSENPTIWKFEITKYNSFIRNFFEVNFLTDFLKQTKKTEQINFQILRDACGFQNSFINSRFNIDHISEAGRQALSISGESSALIDFLSLKNIYKIKQDLKDSSLFFDNFLSFFDSVNINNKSDLNLISSNQFFEMYCSLLPQASTGLDHWSFNSFSHLNFGGSSLHIIGLNLNFYENLLSENSGGKMQAIKAYSLISQQNGAIDFTFLSKKLFNSSSLNKISPSFSFDYLFGEMWFPQMPLLGHFFFQKHPSEFHFIPNMLKHKDAVQYVSSFNFIFNPEMRFEQPLFNLRLELLKIFSKNVGYPDAYLSQFLFYNIFANYAKNFQEIFDQSTFSQESLNFGSKFEKRMPVRIRQIVKELNYLKLLFGLNINHNLENIRTQSPGLFAEKLQTFVINFKIPYLDRYETDSNNNVVKTASVLNIIQDFKKLNENLQILDSSEINAYYFAQEYFSDIEKFKKIKILEYTQPTKIPLVSFIQSNS